MNDKSLWLRDEKLSWCVKDVVFISLNRERSKVTSHISVWHFEFAYAWHLKMLTRIELTTRHKLWAPREANETFNPSHEDYLIRTWHQCDISASSERLSVIKCRIISASTTHFTTPPKLAQWCVLSRDQWSPDVYTFLLFDSRVNVAAISKVRHARRGN